MKDQCLYCDELIDTDIDLDSYLDDEIVCESCREMLDAKGIDRAESSGEDALQELESSSGEM
jgi:hypothetical protein